MSPDEHRTTTTSSARGVDTRRRRSIATYDNYADAERAVDYLADHGFAVERAAILGHDLRMVEQVTGRVTYARAALQGALTGALTGLLVGWLFGLFDWFNPIVAAGWLALDGLWFGAIIGALFGMLAHRLNRDRDFASVGGIQAGRFEVVVDEEVADDALRLIAAFEDQRFSRS